MYFEHIKEKFGLTDAELKFLTYSKTVQKDDMNQSRVVSEMYLSKTLDTNVNKIIESYKELSKSNDKHSKWMKWLTFALVFVAVMQLVIKVFDGR